MIRFWNLLLNTLLPPLCPNCNAKISSLHAFCPTCFSSLTFITPPFCQPCGFPYQSYVQHQTPCFACRARPPAFDQAFAPLLYNPTSDKPILAFKHADATQYAPLFAKLMTAYAPDELQTCNLILPVPLHPLRLWARLYNQSALLAHNIAKIWNIPCKINLLTRTQHSPPLGKMKPTQRYKILKNIFSCPHPNKIQNKQILLIDDVMTSALTTEICARTLKNAGAKSVSVLTLARVHLPRPTLPQAI